MKKFIFKFEKLRQIRIHEERMEQMAFAKVMQVLIDIENRINESQGLIRKYIQMNKQFSIETDINYLAFRDHSVQNLKRRIKQDTRLHTEQSARVEVARERLMEKTKKRKALDKLYDKEWQRYKKEFYEEEGKILDEIGTQIFHRNQLLAKKDKQMKSEGDSWEDKWEDKWEENWEGSWEHSNQQSDASRVQEIPI